MFSYYNCPQNIPENKKDEDIEPEHENLKDKIERKIKTKHNMLIPAIYMEVKPGKESIQLNKEDLKTVTKLT